MPFSIRLRLYVQKNTLYTATTNQLIKVKWKSCNIHICFLIYFDFCFPMRYKFSSRPFASCDIVDGSVTGGSEFVSKRKVKSISSFLCANSNLFGAPEWRVGVLGCSAFWSCTEWFGFVAVYVVMLTALTFWRRNYFFKFKHTPYIKCE